MIRRGVSNGEVQVQTVSYRGIKEATEKKSAISGPNTTGNGKKVEGERIALSILQMKESININIQQPTADNRTKFLNKC